MSTLSKNLFLILGISVVVFTASFAIKDFNFNDEALPTAATLDVLSSEISAPVITSTSSFESGYSTIGNKFSFPHTVPNNDTNRLLIVLLGNRSGTINSVKYSGIDLTPLNQSSNIVGNEIWYLKNPPTGTANVDVAVSKDTTFVAGVLSISGANLNNSFGQVYTVSGNQNTSTANLSLSSATTDLLIGNFIVQRDLGISNPGKQNVLWTLDGDGDSASGRRIMGLAGKFSNVESASFSWKLLNTSATQSWVASAVAVRAPGNDEDAGTDTGNSSEQNSVSLFSSPVSGQVVSGIIVMEVDPSDNDRVESVQFKVDGKNIGSADTSAPYTATWDSLSVSDGQHTLSADIKKASSNTESIQVNISTKNQTGQIPDASGSAYYISPTGSDSNSGLTDVSPLKTFSKAIPKLRPGDILVLMNGIYTPQTTGMPDIDCTANARNGTENAHITMIAQSERRAFLSADGGEHQAFEMSHCSYWDIIGLRGSSVDRTEAAGGKQRDVFQVVRSSNITLKKLLATHPNRYFNDHPIKILDSEYVLLEDSEIYDYQRHGLSVSRSQYVTIRRLYNNGRPNAPDEAIALYPASNVIVENSILDGEQHRGIEIHAGPNLLFNGLPGGHNNRLLGNISIGGVFAGYVDCRPVNVTGEDLGLRCPHGNVYKDYLVIGTQHPFMLRAGTGFTGTGGTHIENVTIINTPEAVLANEAPSDKGTDKICAGIPDGYECAFTVTNALVLGTSGNILSISTPKYKALMENSDIYNNSVQPSENISDTSGIYRRNISVNPKLAATPIYIPDDSPLKGAGKNGEDIGANILYRYVDGKLTNQPLWDLRTGAFPCGAIVPGVNDIPGQSCFDVHKRLNINAATLAAAYGTDIPTGSDNNTPPPVEVDNEYPEVSVESISSGDFVSGTIELKASASDNKGIAGVRFKIDGSNAGSEEIHSPYKILYDTANLTNGQHTITAVARDAYGNVTISSPVVFNVSNARPVDSISMSPNDAFLTVETGDTIQLSAVAKDSSGNLTGSPINWTTTNGVIASVSSTGLVTGHSVGTVVIYASAGGKSSHRAVTVVLPSMFPQGDSDNDGVNDGKDKCPGTPAALVSTVNQSGCVPPIANEFNIKSDLSDKDLKNVVNFELGVNNKGKIKFLESVSLVRDGERLNLDSYVHIEKNRITIESDKLPELNEPALITMYDIDMDNPVVYKDGQLCTNCTINSYSKTSGTLIFTVPGFSVYEVVEAPTEDTNPSTHSSGGIGYGIDYGDGADFDLSKLDDSDFEELTPVEAMQGTVKTLAALNVRSQPSLSASVLAVAPINSTGTVVSSEPVVADGYTWVKVQYSNGYTGWSATSYLSGLTTTATSYTPTAVSVTPVVTQTPTSSIISASDRIQSTSGLNIRSGPSLLSQVLSVVPNGVQGSVLSGPITADGYQWVEVKFDNGLAGWSATTYMVSLTHPIASPVYTGTSTDILRQQLILQIQQKIVELKQKISELEMQELSG